MRCETCHRDPDETGAPYPVCAPCLARMSMPRPLAKMVLDRFGSTTVMDRVGECLCTSCQLTVWIESQYPGLSAEVHEERKPQGVE